MSPVGLSMPARGQCSHTPCLPCRLQLPDALISRGICPTGNVQKALRKLHEPLSGTHTSDPIPARFGDRRPAPLAALRLPRLSRDDHPTQVLLLPPPGAYASCTHGPRWLDCLEMRRARPDRDHQPPHGITIARETRCLRGLSTVASCGWSPGQPTPSGKTTGRSTRSTRTDSDTWRPFQSGATGS